jgi:hypothetical protein
MVIMRVAYVASRPLTNYRVNLRALTEMCSL